MNPAKDDLGPSQGDADTSIEDGNLKAVGSPIEHTDAELAVLAEAKAESESGTEGEPGEGGGEPPAKPDAASALAAAAAQLAASAMSGVDVTPPAPAAPASAVAIPPPPPQLVDPAKPPKDFDAEFTALEKRYDDGDLDQSEYNKALRGLTIEEAEFRALVKHQQAAQQQWEQQRNSAIEQAWQSDVQAFIGSHPRYAASTVLAQMLQEQVSALNDPALSNADLLARADEEIRQALGIDTTRPIDGAPAAPAQPAAAAKPTQPPPPARKPDLRDLPKTLSGAPAAAPTGDGQRLESMLAMDIESLEVDVLARMSEDDRDRMLRQLPGSDTLPFGR